MKKNLQGSIQPFRLTWIVLESSHNQEDADYTEDNPQRSKAKPTEEDYQLCHLGIQCRQVEPPSKLGRVCLYIEQVEGNTDENEPKEYHQENPERLLKQQCRPVLSSGS